MAARRTLRAAALVATLALAAGARANGAAQQPRTPSAPDAAPASAGATTSTPATSPAPAGPPTQAELDRVAVRLDRVARLREPVAMAVAGGDATLYAGERAGRLRVIRDGRLDPGRCWT